MASRQEIINQKLALQDSIKIERDPKKKKQLQKRFDKLRIPTHTETEAERNKKLRAATPNAVTSMKARQATLDSLRKAKSQ